MSISLNVGITQGQLEEVVGIIKTTIGRLEARQAKSVLKSVLESKNI